MMKFIGGNRPHRAMDGDLWIDTGGPEKAVIKERHGTGWITCGKLRMLDGAGNAAFRSLSCGAVDWEEEDAKPVKYFFRTKTADLEIGGETNASCAAVMAVNSLNLACAPNYVHYESFSGEFETVLKWMLAERRVECAPGDDGEMPEGRFHVRPCTIPRGWPRASVSMNGVSFTIIEVQLPAGIVEAARRRAAL